MNERRRWMPACVLLLTTLLLDPRHAIAAEKTAPPRTDRYGDPLPAGAIARLGTTRFRNGCDIDSIAFSPDGKTLASTAGTVVCLWDAATGKLVRQLPAHYFGVNSVTFSPDGKLLAAGSPKGPLLLWSLATGKEIHQFGDEGSNSQVVFSPDGKLLAASDRKQAIQIWDVTTGNEVRRVQGHSDFVLSVAFSPDGKLLASASKDGTIRLWVTATGKETLRLGDLRGEVRSVVFSPDGNTLVSAEGSSVRFHSIGTGKLVDELKLSGEWIHSVAFSPDGKSLATVDWGLAGPQIRLRDVSTHEVIRSIAPSASARCIAFSPDGKALAAGGGDSVIRVWDVATGKEISGPTGHEHRISSLAFLQGAKVLGTESEDGTVRLWDAVTGKEAHKVHIRSKNKGGPGFAFSPNGKHFVFVPDWQDKHICLWDLETGRELRMFNAPEVIRSVSFSPHGTVLAASTKGQTTLLFDVATGKEIRRLAGPESTHFLTFSSDGKALAGIGEDHEVYVWDMDSGEGKTVGTLAGVTIYHHLLRFSPNGKAVLVSGDDNAVRLWDVATRKELRTFAGHRGSVLLLAFSADGKALGSASDDTTGLIWSAPEVLKGGRVHAVALTEKELKNLWVDLADPDAGKAYRAMWTMIPAPAQTVPFLKQQLRPAAPPDRERIGRLLKELDDKQSAIRQKAAEELGKLGELAEAGLLKALAAKPSAEVRRRLEELLQKLQGPITRGETLQGLRAVAVLEHIGTPEAQAVLKDLAQGAPEARLTQEAKAALERVAKRLATKP